MFDFTKFKVVESLSKVPSQFHPFYVEGDDGKFKLDSENTAIAAAVAAISGQQKTITTLRSEVDTAKSKSVDLSALSDYGTTPEEISTAVQTKVDDLQKQVSSKNTDGAAQLATVKEEHAKQLSIQTTAKDEEISGLTRQLHTQQIGGELTTAFTKLGMIPEAIEDSVRTFGASGSLRMEKLADGRVVPRVVDANGEAAFNGAGDYKTPTEFAEDIKNGGQHDYLFQSTKIPGGGSKHQQHQQRPGQKTEDMNPTDKIAAGLDATTK